jgi:hypothetical protein
MFIVTYSKDWIDKYLSDTFPIKNGLRRREALSPLLSNFVLAYVIMTIGVNHDGLKLNATLRYLLLLMVLIDRLKRKYKKEKKHTAC